MLHHVGERPQSGEDGEQRSEKADGAHQLAGGAGERKENP